jgi:hypothetical protein
MAVGLGVAALGACGGGGTKSLGSSAVTTAGSTSASTAATTGPATTAAGAAPSPDAPCTLLTADQVQAALGTGLKSAPRADVDADSGSKGCEWPTVDVMQQFTVDVYGDDRYMPKTDDPRTSPSPASRRRPSTRATGTGSR